MDMSMNKSMDMSIDMSINMSMKMSMDMSMHWHLYTHTSIYSMYAELVLNYQHSHRTAKISPLYKKFAIYLENVIEFTKLWYCVKIVV